MSVAGSLVDDCGGDSCALGEFGEGREGGGGRGMVGGGGISLVAGLLTLFFFLRGGAMGVAPPEGGAKAAGAGSAEVGGWADLVGGVGGVATEVGGAGGKRRGLLGSSALDVLRRLGCLATCCF